MNITPDLVMISLQTLPFLVTLVALHFILFRPMLAHLFEREAAVVEVGEQTRSIATRAEEAQARWDERLAQARAEGAALRARLHGEAAARRNALLHDARAEADARVSAALAEVTAARDAARDHLRALSGDLATDIASRVLDRPVRGTEAR